MVVVWLCFHSYYKSRLFTANEMSKGVWGADAADTLNIGSPKEDGFAYLYWQTFRLSFHPSVHYCCFAMVDGILNDQFGSDPVEH